MKKLLLIAYFFPPLGGAGVQRTAKFAKYLARLGWQLEVISVEPDRFKLFDASLEQEIDDPNIKVHRLAYCEPFCNLNRLPGGWRIRIWLQNWWFFPDLAGGWIHPAIKIAQTICVQNPGITIMTSSAPFSAHLIGKALKQKYQGIWVADFRDEWTQNPYLSFPTRFHLWRHRRAEQSVLIGADIVISVTDAITKGLAQIAPRSKAHFETIPNGYDPQDFLELNSSGQSRFILTHAGTLNPTRAKLLKTLLNLLKKKDALWESKIHLRFVGAGSYRELNLCGLEWVDFIDYIPHKEAIRMMCESDLLILAEPNPKAFTGKIFEYLRTRRPILGLVHPESPAARLIHDAHAGWIIQPEDIPALHSVLLQCFQAKQTGIAAIQPREEIIRQYSRESQAKRLEEIILARQSQVSK